MRADFGDIDEVRRNVAFHVRRTGSAQILVNNTGGPPAGPLVEAAPRDFAAAIESHVGCGHALVQELLPGMRESGYGRIINIVSTSVIAPIPGLGVSNTTRAAVANWARTLAHELGPSGITVNNVLPGYTATARLEELAERMAVRRALRDRGGRRLSRVPRGILCERRESAGGRSPDGGAVGNPASCRAFGPVVSQGARAGPRAPGCRRTRSAGVAGR